MTATDLLILTLGRVNVLLSVVSGVMICKFEAVIGGHVFG